MLSPRRICWRYMVTGNDIYVLWYIFGEHDTSFVEGRTVKVRLSFKLGDLNCLAKSSRLLIIVRVSFSIFEGEEEGSAQPFEI